METFEAAGIINKQTQTMRIAEEPKNEHPILFAIAIILIAIFSYFALHTTKIGTYSDDIQYLLAARSISTGHYTNLYAPVESPVVNYHPGYPAALAIISKITGWNENFFRIFTFLFVWGSLAFFYISIKNVRIAKPILLLCALSPLMIWHIGDIMPDALFMLTSYTIIFLAIDSDLEPCAFKPLFYIIIFLTIISFYVRPTGLINIAFIFIFYMTHKHRASAWYALLLFIVFTLPLFIYNRITAGSAFHYINLFNSNSILTCTVEFSRNIMFYLTNLCTKGLLYIPQTAPKFIAVSLMVLIVFSVLMGIYSLKGNKSVKIIALWSFCYIIFHSFWIYADVRYLFIILPIALFFFIQGIYTITKHKTFFLGSALMIVGFSFVPADIQLIRNSSHNKKENQYFQSEKYEWIKNNIKDKLFLSFYPPRLYYYTGNKSYSMSLIKNPDLFYSELIQKNIEYIFLTDTTASLRTDTSDLPHKTTTNYIKEFTSNNSLAANKRYELIYKDKNTDVEIYKVISDKDFLLKYYVEKRFNELASSKNFVSAESFISLLNKYFPDSCVVQTEIALFYIQQNKTDTAGIYFEKASKSSPDYLPCLYNYGIFNLKNGDIEKGRSLITSAYEKAFSLQDNEYLKLTTVIRNKLKS